MRPASQLPRSTGRVIVVGSLNVDLIWAVPRLPLPGQTLVADAAKTEFGGKGANQAVATARYGAHVFIVGAVGHDADGARYLAHLKRERIDPTWIATINETTTGTAHVYVNPAGENAIVINPGANARVKREQVVTALETLLRAADAVLIQQECPVEAVLVSLELAARHGIRSILNASPVNTAFPWGTHPIDIVIVNEHECSECFGRDPTQFQQMSQTERALLLKQFAVSHVVITQGRQPTLHFSADSDHVASTHPVVPVDTVGAGDTFSGVLAARLALNSSWDTALAYANVAAALSTLASGAQTAMPTQSEVDVAILTQRAQDTASC